MYEVDGRDHKVGSNPLILVQPERRAASLVLLEYVVRIVSGHVYINY